MYGMTPNMQIGIGLGVAVLAAVLFSPKVRGLVMKFLTPSPTPSPTPKPLNVDNPLDQPPTDAHQVVTSLMVYFASVKDDKGVALAAAIGQHLYEEFAKTIEKANTPIAPEVKA